jgi:acyl-CoA synthetase (NDP forming)
VSAERARAICRLALETRGECWLRTDEVAGVLAAFGLPTLPITECGTADEAAQAAQRCDGPVAVKLLSDTLVHKTEWGGVVLGVEGAEAARRAYETIAGKLEAVGRGSEMRGVSVQPMAGQGLETMIGFALDPNFGPLIAFGLGGTALELFGDVVFRITPLTDRDAAEMLASIRGHALLDGYRNQPAADKAALTDMLLRVARLADDVPEIAELDLNPVLARPPGQGAVALDARMLVKRPAARARPDSP